MKINFLFLLLISCFALRSMEPEPEKVPTFQELVPSFGAMSPAGLGVAYQEEQRKFKRYNLDDETSVAKEVLAPLRQSDLIDLKNLQIITSLLLVQHTLMQNLAKLVYLNEYIENLQQAARMYESRLAELHPRAGVTVYNKIRTPEAVNALLRHGYYFYLERPRLEEVAKVVLPWLLSDNQELRWLGLVARFMTEARLIIIHRDTIDQDIVTLMDQARNPSTGIFDMGKEGLAYPLVIQPGSQADMKKATQRILKVVRANTRYLERLLTNKLKFQERIERIRARRGEAAPGAAGEQVWNDYIAENKKIAETYWAFQREYEKLYKILRSEMNVIILRLLKAHPGDIGFTKSLMQHNRTLPLSVSRELLPEILPTALSPLNNPINIIKLFSLDPLLKALEPQFKKQQEQRQRQAQAAKKLHRRRRRARIKTQPPAVEQPIEEVEEEPTPEEQSLKIIAEGPDGSFIVEGEETDSTITIHNPANNTTEVIFKNSTPYQLKGAWKPEYTHNVLQWFENPQQALIDQGYTTPGYKSYMPPDQRWKSVVLHGFSPLVDSYIPEWGDQTTTESRENPGQQDYLITLPGMIIYPDGTKELGIYAYIINSKTGKWYHRMFEPRTGRRLISDLFEKGYFAPQRKGYYEVAFPPQF